MATIVLSALGAAAGASVGGGFLGLSAVAIGRAVGAVAGRWIDQAVLGMGSEPVEQGRIDRFRLVGASEGTPVPTLYGRMRIGGQVIWASPVTEHVQSTSESGSGKGMMSGPRVDEYSYTISLAVALCEGEISHVGRVWADGEEIAPETLNMRVYTGKPTQLPDPKIEAVEGAAMVPAYRGTAYVLLEEIDITRFGNRIPVLNFEVFRPEARDAAPEVARGVKAVAMIPGTGEYALATTTVHKGDTPGEAWPINEHSPMGKSDFSVSLDMLTGELPALEAVSLVVSWFGDDLRCNHCTITPRVEQVLTDAQEMPWEVSGLTRAAALTVPLDGSSRPIYGGTPTDASVVEAIRAIKHEGKAVTFYPFILMTQAEGNSLPDPYSGQLGQAVLPWRGRITASLAPGMPFSPDLTAAMDGQVATFFGSASASDFAVDSGAGTVSYSGPAEWSYRRFILHNAALCAAAGGVESFLIGSELRGLTWLRGASNSYPVVAALIALAAEVRSLLPTAKLSYAADWSEYFGHHPGGNELYFHLDPLWANANIDYIGIDNYMPLSDWREGDDQADAGWGSIYNLDYLKANILGGEGYDWYYHSPNAEEIQLRTPITDGAYDEPWVWRYKDIKSWWQSTHHNRPGGVRNGLPTAWVPGSKPIRFTEYGCAAIDRGTNQPNKFLDPKSSESSLPKYSNGRRDDFLQMQYIRALGEFWADPANNPTDAESGVQMLDMSRAFLWAWDARPFPWFPADTGTWTDGDNYYRGHWLNGRSTNRSLGSVVTEICDRAGLGEVDTSALYGSLRGYSVTEVTGGRNAIQPLMLAYGFEAAEREGTLVFFSRDGRTDRMVDAETLALTDELDGSVELIRAPEAEMVGRVRLNFIESAGDYETRATEAIFPDERTTAVSGSELPLVLTRGEGLAITERWLAEARVSRDRANFALPPSALGTLAGDIVELDLPGGKTRFRVDHVEQSGVQMIQAVRVEPRIYEPSDAVDESQAPRSFTPAVPVFPLFMDLPLITGEESAIAPHMAVTALPWPGSVAVYSAPDDAGYGLIETRRRAARIGVTETVMTAARAGVIDPGPALRVRFTSGTLASTTFDGLLNGANVAVIGDGTAENWEVFQFANAVLVEAGVWELSGRLRGQAGSDAIMPDSWPAGSYVVILDKATGQIPLSSSQRGLERDYRIGPASRPLTDATYVHQVHAFNGIGLRPLAPVHLTASDDGAGGKALGWIRRTRIDGDDWAAVEVPLGEESEIYVLRIMDGSTVLRELTLSSPAYTYSYGMRVADGTLGGFSFEVAQVSTRFGPGPFRRLDVA